MDESLFTTIRWILNKSKQWRLLLLLLLRIRRLRLFHPLTRWWIQFSGVPKESYWCSALWQTRPLMAYTRLIWSGVWERISRLNVENSLKVFCFTRKMHHCTSLSSQRLQCMTVASLKTLHLHLFSYLKKELSAKHNTNGDDIISAVVDLLHHQDDAIYTSVVQVHQHR